jgi:glycosyltransferase involved in cell wall biosynthesis
MRVTYAINARLAGGGIGNIAHHAVIAIHRRGWLHRLIVNSTSTNEFNPADVRSLGLVGRGLKRMANYDGTNTLNSWGDALFDYWAAHQIPACDIFHCWNNHALRSLHAAKQRGIATILERGGSHILQSDELLRHERTRWGWRTEGVPQHVVARSLREFDEADYIMMPSQYNVDSFVARGFPRSRLLLLPYGVNTQQFTPNPQRPDKPFRALFVGQVSLRKGIQYLLQAWRKAALPNAELIVAGQIKPDAARATAPYRAEPSICWLGYISDPVELYQSADVFVFPSIDEGSALVTYEAMACGLPTIITLNAGSLVRDEVDGFVVPPGDSDAVAGKLCWFHAHPDERKAMGRAARAAIEPMTWERYGTALLNLYEQCAGARG